MTRKSLSSTERIKSKKDLENIFSNGVFLISRDRKIKVQYIIKKNPDEEPGVKIAATVSKKLGNAVWRNRLKRLIRESYRLNKNILVDFCVENKILVLAAFSTSALNQRDYKKIKLHDVMSNMIEVMTKIKEGI